LGSLSKSLEAWLQKVVPICKLMIRAIGWREIGDSPDSPRRQRLQERGFVKSWYLAISIRMQHLVHAQACIADILK
jgi:hypothetical protein